MVLDYLWGPPTAAALHAVVTGRTDRDRPLTEVGSPSPGRTPRSRRPRCGPPGCRSRSGQGSVPTRDIPAELPELAARIVAGAFRVDARPVPLADVTAAWRDTGSEQRLVVVP